MTEVSARAAASQDGLGLQDVGDVEGADRMSGGIGVGQDGGHTAQSHDKPFSVVILGGDSRWW